MQKLLKLTMDNYIVSFTQHVNLQSVSLQSQKINQNK